MTRLFHDWEFIENGRTIAPISVGMVFDYPGPDGELVTSEYYAVNADMPVPRIRRHQWLMENVWPHLPLKGGSLRHTSLRHLDLDHPDVKSLRQIREEVRALFERHPPAEMWGYYAAFDHVRLAQLFGPMVSRPATMPMITMDVVQEAIQRGIHADLWPEQPANVHHPLADARWTRQVLLVLDELAPRRQVAMR